MECCARKTDEKIENYSKKNEERMNDFSRKADDLLERFMMITNSWDPDPRNELFHCETS